MTESHQQHFEATKFNPQNTAPMSVKDWAITLLLTSLPLIGIILLLVWAFGSDTNINKQNYAKGALILYALIIAMYIVLIIVFGSMVVISGKS